MWTLNHFLKRYGGLLRRSFLMLLLFCVFSISSLNAMPAEDILSNLTLSLETMTTLQIQLNNLEQELTSKDQQLISLGNNNLQLENQLQSLTTQYNQQTNTLENLLKQNQELTQQSEQLGQQSIALNQSLLQLETELSKAESNRFWWGVGGFLLGALAGGLITWVIVGP